MLQAWGCLRVVSSCRGSIFARASPCSKGSVCVCLHAPTSWQGEDSSQMTSKWQQNNLLWSASLPASLWLSFRREMERFQPNFNAMLCTIATGSCLAFKRWLSRKRLFQMNERGCFRWMKFISASMFGANWDLQDSCLTFRKGLLQRD